MADALARAHENLRRWREAPDGVVQFAREVLQIEPDPWQAEAWIDYHTKLPRTVMKACKNPGKTLSLGVIAWHFLACYPHPNVAATSITGENLRDGLWKEMARLQLRSDWLMQEFQWTAERVFHRRHPGTWWMSARKWSKSADATQQANTLAGLHNDYMLFLLDETGGMPRSVMAAADAALGSGKVVRLVQAGNPTNLEGPLYDACTTERAMWNVIDITGDPDDPKRAPRVKIEWARAQIAKYGRESPWVLVNVFGRFPPASLNALLGIDEVEEAMKRHLTRDVYEWSQKRLGVDVARYGDDLTVLFPRQGLASFTPVAMSHPRNSPVSVDIAARVAMAQAKWGHEMEFYDDTVGWAHGAIDVRRTHPGSVVIPVAMDRPAFDPRYRNMRAYCWMQMADWVKRGGALPNVPELTGELTVPTYMFHQGKFMIEPKDEIKARLGRSPNYADALSCTFAIPDAPNQMQDAVQRLLGINNAHHARTEFDPYRDTETEQQYGRALTEFDPLRDSI